MEENYTGLVIEPNSERENESIRHIFTIICRSRDSHGQRFGMCVSIGLRFVAWFASLMFGNLCLAQAPCPGIHVKILNIRNSTGTVDCALFASPDGFPREFLHSAVVVMVLKIRETQARCDCEDIPPGTYALGVIHDENMNGKLDANWLGIPKEGYGFVRWVEAEFYNQLALLI